MKNKKLMIIIGSSLAFIIFFILIFHKSFAVPLESGTKVASNTDLTYYIDVIYDGVDASAVASSDTATANVNSDYIYVEDKLPNGLTFKKFVTTSDGTIGAVKRSDGTSCSGYVVGDSAGLVYDSATRTVSFKVKNLQAGCKLTVGIVTTTPNVDKSKRMDFYNTAFAREDNFTFKSNTVHVFMGDEDSSLYTVTYKYTGTVPDEAVLPTTSSYSAGTTVGVEANPTVPGYNFSGWSSSEVTVSNGSFTMPSSNVTFTGSFTEKTKYAVTYSVTGDVPEEYISPLPKTYGAGDDVKVDTLKAGDIINGYKFLGWTSTTVDLSEGIFTMPSESVSIVGKFEIVKYTVTYKFQGAVMPNNASSLLPATKSYAPGEMVTLEKISDVSGYKFMGWYKENTFEMPSSNVTIYGEWMFFNGNFAPEVSISIVDAKSSYKKGEVVSFKIDVKNTAAYAITDVIVQENLSGATFSKSSNYTLLNSTTAKISTIAAGATASLNASYTAGSDIVNTITNTVELTGAIADNYYYIDQSKSYKVTEVFKVSNIVLNMSLIDKNNKNLSGGQFTLYSDAALSNAISTGLSFEGLTAGTTYYLKETRVPTGYMKLNDTYTVLVESDGNILFNNTAYSHTNGVINVSLQSAEINMLPNTGGPGNIPYMVIGLVIILLASAGYVFYTKRRVEAI